MWFSERGAGRLSHVTFAMVAKVAAAANVSRLWHNVLPRA